jgi:hypothetical protein
LHIVRRDAEVDLGADTYRWPPLSSVKLCFQTLPSWTLISRPSVKSWPSGGCSFAKFPGRSSAKMPPKSLKRIVVKSNTRVQGAICARSYPFTFSHVVFKASRLYRSSSSIVCSIFSLSFRTVPSIFFRLASRFSTLSRSTARVRDYSKFKEGRVRTYRSCS